MSASLRISCAVNLPLPADFILQPLLRNERLSSLGNQRYFYPVCLLLGLVLWLLHVSIPWNGSLAGIGWTIYAMYLLDFSLGTAVFLTQMDRRLMSLLLRSFEYGFLLAELLLMETCLALLNHGSMSLVTTFLSCSEGLLIISLDAFAGMGRRSKGCILALNLFLMAVALLAMHLNPNQIGTDMDVTCFFYRSTVKNLLGSAMVTLTLFIIKYIYYILFRPGKLLILTSNIACSVHGEHGLLDADVLRVNSADDLSAPLVEVVVQERVK
jgi:hypothetical protein